MFCKKVYRSSIQKKTIEIDSCLHVHVNVHVYDQYCTWMAQVSGLSCGCCPCPRPSSPPVTITFLPCLPGTMLRAPLVSASPSCSPSQCPVQHPPAAASGRPSPNSFLSLSMMFMVFQRGRLFPASGHGRLLLLP